MRKRGAGVNWNNWCMVDLASSACVRACVLWCETEQRGATEEGPEPHRKMAI